MGGNEGGEGEMEGMRKSAGLEGWRDGAEEAMNVEVTVEIEDGHIGG